MVNKTFFLGGARRPTFTTDYKRNCQNRFGKNRWAVNNGTVLNAEWPLIRGRGEPQTQNKGKHYESA